MKCHCGGELYQFQPGNNPIGGDVTGLPSVCRLCGEIRVDGKAVQLPASFQEKTAKLAEEAAQAGAEADTGRATRAGRSNH